MLVTPSARRTLVWGPPTYPATVVDHDLTPGGRMTCVMTGPQGDKHAGYWQITAIDEPTSRDRPSQTSGRVVSCWRVVASVARRPATRSSVRVPRSKASR